MLEMLALRALEALALPALEEPVLEVVRIILKNTSGGAFDQDQPFVPTEVSKGQGGEHIGQDGLDLMGFVPDDIGAASDVGSVEDVCGLHNGEVDIK
ncbi:hypothetical protein F0562_030678 [Nyssa sinensis]|uniref:Uncharacterized protein n=1 Tax=Nyssa sinensis TaxID=561372 RepID=A0A5J5AX29_9ASTE|nr:hypothetical protein F0562_030678 [Nyssa sinensis]